MMAKATVAWKFPASLSYRVATRRQSFRCQNALDHVAAFVAELVEWR